MQNMTLPTRLISADSSSLPCNGLRSFRVNGKEERRERVLDLLSAEGFRFEPEPFSPAAFRLREEPFPLGRSLAAFFGLIYIQDRSSMLPPLLLAPREGDAVLDMCASPGSKTGFLSHLVGGAGFVLGNEPNPVRLGTLRANLSVQNFLQASTCRFQGQDLPVPAGRFSCILLDPPCSGWGTAEKNPQVMKLWRGDKTKTLVGLQRALLAHAAKLLAPGGSLVYSTCTTHAAENGEQAAWALAELPLVSTPLSALPGFDGAVSVEQGAISVDPGLGAGQGFFVAKFSKLPGAAEEVAAEETDFPAGFELVPRSALDGDCVDSGLLPPGELVEFRGNVMFAPKAQLNLLPPKINAQGCFVGKLSGGSVLPLPRLWALMRCPPEAPALNVEDVSPIKKLLSGQSMDVDFPGKSWAGLYYKGLPLALLRVKGGRAIWTER